MLHFKQQILAVSISTKIISCELKIHSNSSAVCGRASSATPRVVGGKKATPYNYPWMVVIFGTTKIHCSGTLINDRYILTAGHCSR